MKLGNFQKKKTERCLGITSQMEKGDWTKWVSYETNEFTDGREKIRESAKWKYSQGRMALPQVSFRPSSRILGTE